jgi:arylsulfatase A-like enzyme
MKHRLEAPMPGTEPRHTPEQLARLASEVFDRQVRPALRPEDDGKFVAIDVDTADYEIAEDNYSAIARLRARKPAADVWLMRAGCPTTYRMGVGMIRGVVNARHEALPWLLALLVLLLGGSGAPAATGAARKPNIVLILADDLGWADLGCYGADLHETPHLDRFARQGVRFTDAYAMSVCSPSRAMLLTGKHAARLRITTWAEGSRAGPKNRKLLQATSRHDLPHSQTTLAKRLHDAGYLTALVGKWHLGDADHYPETHGFDVNIGGTRWGAPQTHFWPYRGRGTFGTEFRYVPHLEFGKPGEYLTDRLTDEALRVIDRAGKKPFFLYLAHHAPHTPIQAKADDVKHFKKKLRPGLKHRHPVYAAMVKSLDESVGRVLAHLKKRGLEDNTLVVFTSDNGGFVGVDRRSGLSVPVTSNLPLRSGKGSLYEGGIRIPLLVRWPGVTPKGVVCKEPVLLADLFHTLVAAAGLPRAKDSVADGLDLSPLLKDPAGKLTRDALFFHYPHYYATTTPVGAVRAGDWKLLEYFEDDHVELYNLKDDPGEKTDLARKRPARAAKLRKRLQAWRKAVDAAMPSPNPGFKAKR